MSNLIPVQRRDKNGHLVTRWVKPTEQSKSASKIPAPARATEYASEESLGWVAAHCTSYSFDGELFEVQLPEAMRNMPKEYAEKFASDFEEEAGASDLAYDIAEVTIKVFGPDSTVPTENRAAVLSNYMSIIPEYYEGKNNEGTDAAHFARIVFEGVKGYEQSELYSNDERVAIKAAVEIVETIFPVPREEGYSNDGFIVRDQKVHLANDESVRLLIENVGNIDRIKEALMSRKTFDPSVVAEIIDNGVLADGSL